MEGAKNEVSRKSQAFSCMSVLKRAVATHTRSHPALDLGFVYD